MEPQVKIMVEDQLVQDVIDVQPGDTINISITKDENWGTSVIEILDTKRNRRFLSRRDHDHFVSMTIPQTKLFGDWHCHIEIFNEKGGSIDFSRTISVLPDNGKASEALRVSEEKGEEKIEDTSKGTVSEKILETEEEVSSEEIEVETSTQSVTEDTINETDTFMKEHLENEYSTSETSEISTSPSMEVAEIGSDQPTVESGDPTSDKTIEEDEVIGEKAPSDLVEDDGKSERASKEIIDIESPASAVDKQYSTAEKNINEEVHKKEQPDVDTDPVLDAEDKNKKKEIKFENSGSTENEVDKELIDDVIAFEETEELEHDDPDQINMLDLSIDKQMEILQHIESERDLNRIKPIILKEDDRNDLEIPIAEMEELETQFHQELKAADLLYIYHILETAPSALLEITNAPVQSIIQWLEGSYQILNNPQHNLRREYRRIRSEFTEYQRQLETMMESARAKDPLSVLVGLDKEVVDQLNDEGIETVGELLQIPVVDLINLEVDPDKPLLPKLWIANAKSHVGIK